MFAYCRLKLAALHKRLRLRCSILCWTRSNNAALAHSRQPLQRILNPTPHVQRQAIRHAWCAKSISRMCQATRTPIPPDDASTDSSGSWTTAALSALVQPSLDASVALAYQKYSRRVSLAAMEASTNPFSTPASRLASCLAETRKLDLSIKCALSRKRKLVSTDTASDSVKMSPTDLPQSAPTADSNADKHAALRSEKQPVQFKDVHANEARTVPAAVIGLTAVSARALMQDQPAVHELAAQAAEHHQPEHCSTEGFEMPAPQQVPLPQDQNAATAELCTDFPPAVDSDRYRYPLSCVSCTVGHASACCRPLL